jgi:hypothetical protein
MTKDEKRDLAELRKFLAHGGLSCVARSSLGPMLDALSRSGESRKCDVCGGLGRVPESLGDEDHERAMQRVTAERAWAVAILRDPPRSRKAVPHLARYRELRDGAAFLAAERYRREHAKEIQTEAREEDATAARALARYVGAEQAAQREDDKRQVGDRWCHVCRGTGWRPRSSPHRASPLGLDARPVGSSVSTRGGGVGGDDAATEWIGRVAGRLARVRRSDPTLADALVRLHSPDTGGVASLWDVVPTGIRLLKAHATDAHPTPGAVWSELAERQRTSPHPRLGAQLDAARREAHDLADRAHRAWLDAAAAPRRPLVPVATAPRRKAPRDPMLDDLCRLVRQAMGGV